MNHILKNIVLITTLSLPVPLMALECDLSGNQMEMNQCAADDFAAADKNLNTVWQQLLKKEEDNPHYIDKLRVAQRAWIDFRDAEIAAMFACEDENIRLCWGSMYPLLYHTEMTELTELRTRKLQTYIEQGQNSTVGD